MPPQGNKTRTKRWGDAALAREEGAVHLGEFQIGHEGFGTEEGAQTHRTAPGKYNTEEEHGVPGPTPSSVEVVEDAPQWPTGGSYADDFFFDEKYLEKRMHKNRTKTTETM